MSAGFEPFLLRAELPHDEDVRGVGAFPALEGGVLTASRDRTAKLWSLRGARVGGAYTLGSLQRMITRQNHQKGNAAFIVCHVGDVHPDSHTGYQHQLDGGPRGCERAMAHVCGCECQCIACKKVQRFFV